MFDVSLYDERKHGVKIQEYVEQPEIYMICMSSSSVDDQAAIIPDRLECSSSLSQPLLRVVMCVNDVPIFCGRLSSNSNVLDLIQTAVMIP